MGICFTLKRYPYVVCKEHYRAPTEMVVIKTGKVFISTTAPVRLFSGVARATERALGVHDVGDL